MHALELWLLRVERSFVSHKLISNRIGAMTTTVSRGNVLIIEDHPDCGSLLRQLIGSSGYTARWVQTRDAAVNMMRAKQFDSIILDVAMPGMTIEEFFRKCHPPLDRVILISAVVDSGKVAERLGVRHWIRKPFNPDQILELLNSLNPAPKNAPAEA